MCAPLNTVAVRWLWTLRYPQTVLISKLYLIFHVTVLLPCTYTVLVSIIMLSFKCIYPYSPTTVGHGNEIELHCNWREPVNVVNLGRYYRSSLFVDSWRNPIYEFFFWFVRKNAIYICMHMQLSDTKRCAEILIGEQVLRWCEWHLEEAIFWQVIIYLFCTTQYL